MTTATDVRAYGHDRSCTTLGHAAVAVSHIWVAAAVSQSTSRLQHTWAAAAVSPLLAAAVALLLQEL